MGLEAISTTLRSPALAAVRAAAGERAAYLVGGAVRDLLDGRRPAELDVAVEGELEPLLETVGEQPSRVHSRFGTASLTIAGTAVDLARTRRESYPQPGALPVVEPAPIRADLARRDFTVNAMAVPLAGPLELLDPYGGQADLEARILRVIHGRSFADDPTRALRAARYCARLGMSLEPETERLLRESDLETVSEDRVLAELGRIAAEPAALTAFGLLRDWGLLDVDDRRLQLIAAVEPILASAPWAGLVERPRLLVRILRAPAAELEAAGALAAASPATPSAAYELAAGHDDETLALARAHGGEWIDAHLARRGTTLEIDGADLLAAGVEEGPAIGRGLRAALHGRLDGTVGPGRESELAAALAAVRAQRDLD